MMNGKGSELLGIHHNGKMIANGNIFSNSQANKFLLPSIVWLDIRVYRTAKIVGFPSHREFWL